jgi:hypothetical protein
MSLSMAACTFCGSLMILAFQLLRSDPSDATSEEEQANLHEFLREPLCYACDRHAHSLWGSHFTSGDKRKARHKKIPQ